MGERPDSFEICEFSSLGGVLPRCAIGAVSGVSGPFNDPLESEVDRSLAGDLLNSRRQAAPIDEARLGRVSADLDLGKSKIVKCGSRTIPENGTADNLSMSSMVLILLGLCTSTSVLESSLTLDVDIGRSFGGRTKIVVIWRNGLRDPKVYP